MSDLIETVRGLLPKITPGPWKDRPQNIPGVKKGRYRYIDFDGTEYDTSPLEPDDARLIALAPEMAAALASFESRLAATEQEARRALMFLDDAIEGTGCTEDELISEETDNVWVRVICARDTLRGLLDA